MTQVKHADLKCKLNRAKLKDKLKRKQQEPQEEPQANVTDAEESPVICVKEDTSRMKRLFV